MGKKLKFLIFGIGGLLALVGILDFLAGTTGNLASLSKGLNPDSDKESQGWIYSFYQDSDLDGLSNAKEVIYGTNPLKADTDGDSYLDGEEVEKGYDPLIAGGARLEERKGLSLTLRYFLWARKEKGRADPNIEEALVEEFLEKEKIASVSKVGDDKIIISPEADREAIRAYLNQVNKIGLPEGIAGYETLAKNYTQESEALLNDLLNQIELAYLDFKKIKTPKEALEIQRDYLTVVKEFYNIFENLKAWEGDPVQIKANVKKAQELIQLAREAERLKMELIKKYDIS